MIRMKNICVLTTAALLLGAAPGNVYAGFRTTTDFEEPTLWQVGDDYTTSQQWDLFLSGSGNTPDVSQSANPAISATPLVDVASPGFVTGTANFYAFSGDYSFTTDVYNHGGSFGAGAPTGNVGTHVIIQTASTLNPDFGEGLGTGVYTDTLQIVDLDGDAITGGDNESVLRHEIIFEDIVSSSFGDVAYREEVFEFYLPGYTGDFRIMSDVIVHSSFDRLRIDSAITSAQLEGDLNGDGFVGVDDLNIVLVNWNQNVTPGDLGYGDPTGEGFVGVDDLNIVLVNWNSGTPPTSIAVPEPATLGLLALASALAVYTRR